jgi:hypothetical protein
MLRVLAPVWDTGNGFWICFGMWGVLDLLGNLLSRNRQSDPSTTPVDAAKPEYSFWWKAFGPLAAFCFVTVFSGLWPLGGFGILLWLISWFIYDAAVSSRWSKSKLTTLSLR